MYRIAIDTGPLKTGHTVRGIGVHTRELLDEFNKIKRNNLIIKGVDFSKSDLSSYDLVHYQSFNPFFISIPSIKPAKKTIITIHDMIMLIYPEYYPPGLKGSIRFLLQKYFVRNIDAIITISETSKEDIVRFLPVSDDKIFITHLAPRKVFRKLNAGGWSINFRKRFALPKYFVLYVGDVNYNKNLLTLAKACEIVKTPLVMVGKTTIPKGIDFNHPENQPFKTFLDKYGVSNNVIRLGFIKDKDLVKVWNLATVYCQPSYYEGFGLPILESMACGVPVVASDIKAHREIAGNSVLFADPKDPNDIAENINKILKDMNLRSSLIKSGFKNIKNYSWQAVASKTLEVYEKVMEL